MDRTTKGEVMSEYEYHNVIGEPLRRVKKRVKHVIRKTLKEDPSKYYPQVKKEEK
jgi:hypothetical protein